MPHVQVDLLTPGEVAQMFRVNPKTVTRWAQAGKLTSVRTLGGHRRYRADEIHALLRGMTVPTAPAAVLTAADYLNAADAIIRDLESGALR